jgi:hypothetical protein
LDFAEQLAEHDDEDDYASSGYDTDGNLDAGEDGEGDDDDDDEQVEFVGRPLVHGSWAPSAVGDNGQVRQDRLLLACFVRFIWVYII